MNNCTMLFFRPLLWPSIATAVALAVLVSLGTWQVHRLEWKEGLLARIAERTRSAPQDLDALLAATPPSAEARDYWRVRVTGTFDHARELYLYRQSLLGAPGYHIIVPLKREEAPAVFVDRGFVPLDRKDPATRRAGQVGGVQTVIGLVRVPAKQAAFVPDNDPAANEWFFVDLPAMAAAAGVRDYLPVIVEADAVPVPGGWPRGGEVWVSLPNNHLGYAITWYGLAAALCAVYLAYHRSKGRLGRAIAPASRDG